MFDLGFDETFFMGEGYSLDGPYPDRSGEPQSVLQALLSLDDSEVAEIREALSMEPETSYDGFVAKALRAVRETDTCRDLSSPVEVWIDPQGYHTIRVYS